MSKRVPKKLLESILNFSLEDQELIKKAYIFALEKHRGVFRKSGEPYINHPLRVSYNLARDQYGPNTIAASLLHDTLEDTDTTLRELSDSFGDTVAKIVDGVTKVSAIRIFEKNKIFSDDKMFLARVDNYRKILLATVNDLRIIIVKLYDRLDNIETIRFMPAEKQKFYARETMEIFAPIAERLGMGVLKGKLEDLSFPYAYPAEYKKFKEEIKEIYKNPQKTVEKVKPQIKNILEDSGIKVIDLFGRAKHLYSLYKKIQIKGSIKSIFDICALRVIVPSIEDCYRALGIIHGKFSPHPNRIHDYIARPKFNGYQSIHTTVKNDDDQLFEIQIRTPEMQTQAEYGLAAHWDYKEKSSRNVSSKSTTKWLKELEKISEIHDDDQLLGKIKEELFSDQIFIFTPKGDIIDLPVESTGIDFAFRIHTKIGSHLSGVKVNGRMVPINTQLKTGDSVEIITSVKAVPTRDWLKIAKTSQARQHIRNYFRNTQYDFLLAKGMGIFNKLLGALKYPLIKKDDSLQKIGDLKLPYKTLDKALIALAENNISQTKLVKALHPEFDNSEKRTAKEHVRDSTSLKALKGIRHSFAGCCKIKDSKNLVGYLTKEHIIKIHRKDCKRLAGADPRRIIDLQP